MCRYSNPYCGKDTTSLMINARSFMAFFTLERKKKKLVVWENTNQPKYWQHASTAFYSYCVGEQYNHSKSVCDAQQEL